MTEYSDLVVRGREDWVDPYFNTIVWDIIKNQNGQVLGEVYMLPPSQNLDGKVRKKVKHGL